MVIALILVLIKDYFLIKKGTDVLNTIEVPGLPLPLVLIAFSVGEGSSG